ncbi:MAG: HAD-IA family hydrolase [Bacteroidota bacterium]
MENLQALLFDCDGVLVDTEIDGHRVAFNKAFANAGLDLVWGVEQYAKLVEVSGGKERMRHYFNQVGWPAVAEEDHDAFVRALHADKTNIFMNMIENGEMELRPGVARLVDACIARGVQLAVCSTSNVRSVTAVVNVLLGPERAKHFGGIFAGDMVKVKKPDPAVYTLAKETLDLDPARCVVVEDTRNGLLAAKAAGMNCLITKSAYTGGEDFTEADRVVNELGADAGAGIGWNDLQAIVAQRQA